MSNIITQSDFETKKIAEVFAKKNTSNVIALSGPLGSGKTTFVQGFAKGLGIKDQILSPTFVLVRQHKIPKSKKILYHIDLYRLEKIDDFKNIGLDEIIQSPGNIVLIEWAEKARNIIPKDAVWINIKLLDHEKRQIEFI